MKFRYIPHRGILKPIVELTISHEGQEFRTRALVDSGADISMFDLDIAQALNIPLDMSQSRRVMGIGGLVDAYTAEIDIELGPYALTLKVLFTRNLPLNLLGRDNFFRVFRVQFDEVKQQLELRRRRRRRGRHH